MRRNAPFLNPHMEKKKQPSIFYGWVIVFISFVCMFIALGARNSFSVFYVAILEEFNWSRAGAAVALSISMFVYGAASPLVGIALDRFGPRKLFPIGAILLALGLIACSQASRLWHFYLMFGLILAIGVSTLGLFPHAAVVSNWFIRRRGTAISLASVGGGAAFLMAILAQYLITGVGWRNAFIVLGISVVVIIVPLAAIFQRHKPEDKGLSQDGEVNIAAVEIDDQVEKGKINRGGENVTIEKQWASFEWTLSKAIGTYRFWALFSAYFFVGVMFSLMLAHQVAFFVDIGFSKMFAASIFGFFGFINSIGRIGGYLSDRIGREKVYTLSSLLCVLAMFILLTVTNAQESWRLYLYAITFGLGIGMNAPVIIIATADLFQGRNLGGISGFMGIGMGIGGAIGPWAGGFIYDLMHSYTAAFILVIIAVVSSCCFMWLSAPRKVRQSLARR